MILRSNITARHAKPGTDWLLLALLLAIALLPIQFHLLKYVILLLFVLVCCYVLVARLETLSLPYSPLYYAVGVFLLIFLAWAIWSLRLGNRLDYALKDAAGFFVYLTFPFIVSYIVIRNSARQLISAVIITATVVSLIHIGAFAVYYSVFDRLTLTGLTAANAFLTSVGFTWELGASGGVLRANTKAGHFILLGLALLFYRFIQTRKPRDLVITAVLLVGALLDGHRALIVAILIFGIMIVPILFRIFQLHPLRTMAPALAGVILLMFTFAVFIDVQGWWDRLGGLSSRGLQVRTGQIEALLAEIRERPLLGNGFGASASVIRSPERPFMYEVDFLAVAMKLGLVGAVLYFSTYLATIVSAFARHRSVYGYVMLSVGIAYFFYMGTNGGFAMSPISSFFHIVLFNCIAVGLMFAEPLAADYGARPGVIGDHAIAGPRVSGE